MKARMKAGEAGEKEERSTSVKEGGMSSEPLWAEAMPMGTRKKLSSNEKKTSEKRYGYYLDFVGTESHSEKAT